MYTSDTFTRTVVYTVRESGGRWKLTTTPPVARPAVLARSRGCVTVTVTPETRKYECRAVRVELPRHALTDDELRRWTDTLLPTPITIPEVR